MTTYLDELIDRLLMVPSAMMERELLKLHSEAANMLHALKLRLPVRAISADEPQQPMPAPTSYWRWEHVKRGGDYTLLGDARIQSDVPLEDLDTVLVYQGADGQLWARPPREFSERFKRLRPLTQVERGSHRRSTWCSIVRAAGGSTSTRLRTRSTPSATPM